MVHILKESYLLGCDQYIYNKAAMENEMDWFCFVFVCFLSAMAVPSH